MTTGVALPSGPHSPTRRPVNKATSVPAARAHGAGNGGSLRTPIGKEITWLEPFVAGLVRHLLLATGGPQRADRQSDEHRGFNPTPGADSHDGTFLPGRALVGDFDDLAVRTERGQKLGRRAAIELRVGRFEAEEEAVLALLSELRHVEYGGGDAAGH